MTVGWKRRPVSYRSAAHRFAFARDLVILLGALERACLKSDLLEVEPSSSFPRS